MIYIFLYYIKIYGLRITFVCVFLSGLLTLMLVTFFPSLSESVDYFSFGEYPSDYQKQRRLFLNVLTIVLIPTWILFLCAVIIFAWINRDDL